MAIIQGDADISSTAASTATGGKIGSNYISNTSGKQGLGLVKLLALAGIALIALKLIKRGL